MTRGYIAALRKLLRAHAQPTSRRRTLEIEAAERVVAHLKAAGANRRT
jgi:hypothetical protein